jgi:GATA-binding protein
LSIATAPGQSNKSGVIPIAAAPPKSNLVGGSITTRPLAAAMPKRQRRLSKSQGPLQEGSEDGDTLDESRDLGKKDKILSPILQQSTSAILHNTTHHTPIAPAVTTAAGTQEWEWLTMSL